jgi:uncharacterized protein (TIGR03067 family)
MKHGPLGMVVLCAALAGGCSKTKDGPPPDEPGKQPAAQTDPALQGTWRVVGIQAAGKLVPEARVKGLNLRYVFAGNTITIQRPGRPEKRGPFEADTTQTPRRLVLKHQSPAVRAVYEVSGDKLRMCVMVDEAKAGEFPNSLASQASPKTDLLSLEKVR